MGTDLCEVHRIKDSVERFGLRFLERVYTPAEIAYVERKANKYERYAARFAAKEAGMKALSTGMRGGVRWHDFEVTNLPSGQPTLRFSGKALEMANHKGFKQVLLTMTHTAQTAMAVVILEA